MKMNFTDFFCFVFALPVYYIRRIHGTPASIFGSNMCIVANFTEGGFRDIHARA